MKAAEAIHLLKSKTSENFVEQIREYVKWAEETEQATLLDVGFMENSSYFSVVVVTSENIVQLIFNKENETITVGTASKDACEYAMKIWNPLIVADQK